jgi:RimJ/RimL family protein N-acetyltransferase
MLQGWIDHWERHGFGYWSVARREDGHILGFSGLQRLVVEDRQVLNLYYRYRPEAWGAGYATEAARAARELARQRLAGEELVALVRDINAPSARVAERLGLVADERLIDHGGVPTRVYRLP